MQLLYVISYKFHTDLDADDLRDLTKKFAEVGNAPGVVAHYASLDGRGGFVIQEAQDDPAEGFKVTLQYAPWIDFETVPVTTIEDAFPVILEVYG
jgi:uncharacterized protein DUF3303